jgi:hypothetical protein
VAFLSCLPELEQAVIRFEVSDTGEGMEPAALSALFQVMITATNPLLPPSGRRLRVGDGCFVSGADLLVVLKYVDGCVCCLRQRSVFTPSFGCSSHTRFVADSQHFCCFRP